MTSPASGDLAVLDRPDVDAVTAVAPPWACRLHNDPVNTTDYVTRALTKVLRCTKEQAERHMLKAHLDGSAVVFTGAADKCGEIVAKLAVYALWATVEKA